MPVSLEQDALLGAILDGRYQITRLIGEGGMGNVYLAEETRLRRRYALKVLHPQLARDRSSVERFLREAQILARLEHPNIVDIYAYGEDPTGPVFFTMELLQGEDLDARIRARADRPFDAHEACVWAIQVARAVAVVHDAGFIHRDLKCSNIFLSRRRDGEEVVKLLDFGIARSHESSELTKTGTTLGTPSYMSPEQVRGLDVDCRSDIYSFGIIVYKLLTGKLPFLGEPIQVAMAHCDRAPTPPSVAAPQAGISPALEAIVLTALAKRPEDRQQTMAEVERALLAVLADEAPDLVAAAEPRRMRTASDLSGSIPRSRTSSSTMRADTTSRTALDPSTASTSPFASTIPMSAGQPHGVPRWLVVTSLGSTLAGVFAVWVLLTSGDKPSPPSDMQPAVAAPLVAPNPSPQAPVVATPTIPPIAGPATGVPATGEPEVDASATAEPATPARPQSTADPTPAPRPPAAAPTDAPAKAAPVDPLKGIKKRALACRRASNAVNGPLMTIDYAIGSNGAVTRAVPAVADQLGRCLAEAVRSASFEPVFAMGLQIDL